MDEYWIKNFYANYVEVKNKNKIKGRLDMLVVCNGLATPGYKVTQHLGEIRKSDPNLWKYEPTTHPSQGCMVHILGLKCLIV